MIRVRGAQVEVGEVIEAGEVYCVVVRDQSERWRISGVDMTIGEDDYPHFRDATPSVPAPGIDAVVGELRAEVESLKSVAMDERATTIRVAAQRDELQAEVERLRKYAPSPEMEALLERSSLGIDEAKADAETVSPDAGRAVVRMAELMRERDEARAAVAAERERIATAIAEVREQVDVTTIDWQHTNGKPARDMTLAALDDCINIARSES